MRAEPAGDFDYDKAKIDYASIRQPEPTFAAAIEAALGSAESLINVGAGTGSYEPLDRQVTAVEPSASQRSQRPTHLTPAIDAVAEDLPFPDDAFDAALATVTVHQWRDLAKGLSEMRRVTRGPVIVMTFAPERLREFWMADYAPEFNQAGCRRSKYSPSSSAVLWSRSSRSPPVAPMASMKLSSDALTPSLMSGCDAPRTPGASWVRMWSTVPWLVFGMLSTTGRGRSAMAIFGQLTTIRDRCA